MNKTEWLSLKLHLERVSELVFDLKAQDGLEYQSLLVLQSELTSMKTMTSLVLSQICCSPVVVGNPEALS